jgi:hypothetical protein
MNLKKVEDVFVQTVVDRSTPFDIGNRITYYRLLPINNTNFVNTPLSHNWSYLSLRTQSDLNKINNDYSNGGLLNTALSGLVDSFDTEGAVMFTIDNITYRTMISGQNFALKIPLDPLYTGSTSGLTATTLYSSFIYSKDLTEKDYTSLCSSVKGDELISESNREFTSNIGIGSSFIEGVNPDPNSQLTPYFNSGVVYLMSDNVFNTFTGSTGSSLSWGYLFGEQNKYSKGARTISFNPSNSNYTSLPGTTPGYDQIAGVLFLNSGVGFIFNKDLVNGMNWSTINGDPYTVTGATWSSGETYSIISDIDITKEINVKIVANPDEWVSSTNSSYIGNGSSDCGIAITNITLHDSNGQCLATIVPDNAMIKELTQYKIVDLRVPLSGSIGSPFGFTFNLINVS